jgi:isopentenyl-diphosphate Delta-isomerase
VRFENQKVKGAAFLPRLFIKGRITKQCEENMADELLDVVNDQDVVIGQQMRSVVHQVGLQHRGVHVLLFTDLDKMLVQKRSADRAASSLLLDCSVSEHVKAGESYLDAAIRGMKEELGLRGIEINPLVLIKMNYGPNDNEISMIFQGLLDPGTVKFDPIEIDDIYYYTLDELMEKMWGESMTFCGWFVEILNWYLGRPSQLSVLKDYRV